MTRLIAVCWTTRGGEGMSRIHVGDPTTGKTLCGKDKSGHLGPYWFPMGSPVAPGTLTHLGGDSAAVSCDSCWRAYEATRQKGGK